MVQGVCRRRCQRDRRTPPTRHPRAARGRSVGFQAGGCGDRRLPDARRRLGWIPDATGDAPAPRRRHRSRACPTGPQRRAGSRSARPAQRRCSRRAPTTAGADRSPSSSARPPASLATDATELSGLDPAPWVANVCRPFLVPSAEMLRTDGPDALTSAAYAHAPQRGQAGSAHSRAGTAPPIRHRPRSSGRTAGPRSGTASSGRSRQAAGWTSSTARAHAHDDGHLAAADGSIGCWNDKYYWNFWRPITAIQEAGADGNPATTADPTWLPLSTRASPSPGRRSSRPASPTTRRAIPASAEPPYTRSRPSSPQTRCRSQHRRQVLSRALPRPQLRPLLPGAQGDHRRSHLERDPLPHRRRAGGCARQEGRPPAEDPLPATPLTRTARAAAGKRPPYIAPAADPKPETRRPCPDTTTATRALSRLLSLANGRVALSGGRGSSTARVVGSSADVPRSSVDGVRTFGGRFAGGASTAARRRARRRPRQTAPRAPAARVSARLRGAAARA